jgi:hypothetical protein
MLQTHAHHPRHQESAGQPAGVLCVGLEDAAVAGIGTLAGIAATSVSDPYAAMLLIAANPRGWQMIVLNLQQMFDAELAVLSAVRAVAPDCRVAVTRADGRPALLARALRLGLDGIFTGTAIEWFTPPPPTTPQASARSTPVTAVALEPTAATPPGQMARQSAPETKPVITANEDLNDDPTDQTALRSVAEIDLDEPLLTAEELKALLSDHGIRPAAG